MADGTFNAEYLYRSLINVAQTSTFQHYHYCLVIPTDGANPAEYSEALDLTAQSARSMLYAAGLGQHGFNMSTCFTFLERKVTSLISKPVVQQIFHFSACETTSLVRFTDVSCPFWRQVPVSLPPLQCRSLMPCSWDRSQRAIDVADHHSLEALLVSTGNFPVLFRGLKSQLVMDKETSDVAHPTLEVFRRSVE